MTYISNHDTDDDYDNINYNNIRDTSLSTVLAYARAFSRSHPGTASLSVDMTYKQNTLHENTDQPKIKYMLKLQLIHCE